MQRGDLKPLTVDKALYNYKKSVDKGLLKILSKMGISLLTSYHGAQIFESIGLSDDVILSAFKGTPSRVSGLTYDEIAAENLEFVRKAYGDGLFANIIEIVESQGAGEGAAEEKSKKLFNYGFLNFYKSGDYHHNNQPLIKTLHNAIRNQKPDLYKLYEESVTSRPPTTLRDMMEFVPTSQNGRKSLSIDDVESTESIMKRFCSGAMSLGALSREAHETLAISMNRIGGKSNSGEGGEDRRRFKPITDVDSEGKSVAYPYLKGLKNGDIAISKVKQVASGRFGVTPEYLMSGSQLEIKVAQGAKPGEGGQLPGAKIDEYIATLRKSKPGVTLISPPPHHDIYSIEDLAQLIYDLHQINPAAAVSVKLVSEVGIGTVASGVAKAGADIIQIAGHDGGTGASPVSSIKHAGSPWELGLVESHSTLLKNGLRERVLLVGVDDVYNIIIIIVIIIIIIIIITSAWMEV
jgi:glutamate synthase (ferredoxin)